MAKGKRRNIETSKRRNIETSKHRNIKAESSQNGDHPNGEKQPLQSGRAKLCFAGMGDSLAQCIGSSM